GSRADTVALLEAAALGHPVPELAAEERDTYVPVIGERVAELLELLGQGQEKGSAGRDRRDSELDDQLRLLLGVSDTTGNDGDTEVSQRLVHRQTSRDEMVGPSVEHDVAGADPSG